MLNSDFAESKEEKLLIDKLKFDIKIGDIESIKNTLLTYKQSKADIPYYFSKGLITAAKHNQVEIIHLLVEHGCDVNFVDITFSMSPLKKSIENKSMNAFKALLSLGADLNQFNCDFNKKLSDTPLKYSIIKYNEMAEHLIFLGADVNQINNGSTPLTVSIIYERDGITQLLIDRGANVNAIIPVVLLVDEKEINSEASAIQIASFKFNSNATRVLIENSADVNLKLLNAMSALMAAIRHSNLGSAKLLIESGANVNEMDSSGDTPLNNAILWRTTSANFYDQAVISNTCIIDLLINAGADIKARNKDNLNALEQAKLVNIPEVVAKIENTLLNSQTNNSLNQTNDLTAPTKIRVRL